jgi:BlaI family penicillinase repressor
MRMKQIPQISAAEWEVMKALWEKSPQTANDVHEALASQVDWQLNTVKTLISRLVRKGALTATKTGRQHLYTPAVARDKCAAIESRSHLARTYDGALMPMIAGLLQHKKLSSQEIAELRRMLDEMEKRQTR